MLHTDEPHPHVHVVVKAVSEQGERLTIRKATLRAWREQFARHLREHGIAANATERAVRGESRTAMSGASSAAWDFREPNASGSFIIPVSMRRLRWRKIPSQESSASARIPALIQELASGDANILRGATGVLCLNTAKNFACGIRQIATDGKLVYRNDFDIAFAAFKRAHEWISWMIYFQRA